MTPDEAIEYIEHRQRVHQPVGQHGDATDERHRAELLELILPQYRFVLTDGSLDPESAIEGIRAGQALAKQRAAAPERFPEGFDLDALGDDL